MNTQNLLPERTTSTALCFELGADVPEWVEVLPPGPQVVGRDGRTWTYEPQQVMASTLAHGADLPFDYWHATELKAPQGDEAPAAGWARGYRLNERGAMEAQVEWTDRARNAIAAREYRYISPVFLYDSAGRIVRFSSFGLVNKPNLAIKALNAEQLHNPEDPTPEVSDMALAAILAALGLPETATEQQAVASINEIRVAANSERAPSLDKYVPRADFDGAVQRANNAEQQLKDREKAELETAINAEIDAALKAGKITPATKAYHVAQCQQDGGLERFRQFVQAAPSVTEPLLDGNSQPGTSTALNAEQKEAARLLGLDEAGYRDLIKETK